MCSLKFVLDLCKSITVLPTVTNLYSSVRKQIGLTLMCENLEMKTNFLKATHFYYNYVDQNIECGARILYLDRRN